MTSSIPHVLLPLPLPWPKFRFWLCDKFNSHVRLPLPWPNLRFWLCDKFNSHVLLPLPWPKFRFWLCDKFNSHVLLPLPWPNLRSWHPIEDGYVIRNNLRLNQIHYFDKKIIPCTESNPNIYRGSICDSDFVTSSIHMSPTPTVAQFSYYSDLGPKLNNWLCEMDLSIRHVLLPLDWP